MIRVFTSYPTFQVFLGVVVAAAITLILTPFWIRTLKRDHIGQQVRAEGPKTHYVKQGTPTMGGVVMLLAATIATLLFGSGTAEMWTLLLATLLMGACGLVDDADKVIHSRSLGLTPHAKLIWQFSVAIIFCLVAVNCLHVPPTIEFPFIATLDLGVLTTTIGGIQIPWLYVIFVVILVAGFSNAVNLTDGLDGLAAGTVMVVMVVMAMIAYRSDLLDASIFAGALAGCCIGFLWFNCFRADIFMGDTGSLALGGALGCLAVVTKTEIVSLIIGGLFVMEALSVILQVVHYRRTHKRLFLMAPLHHHFEKKGWGESKVVIRFWIISGTFAAVGFFLYFANSMVGVV